MLEKLPVTQNVKMDKYLIGDDGKKSLVNLGNMRNIGNYLQ
jgi:hypothetical protein